MLYYDRINVPEEIDVNKIDVSKMWCLSLHCTKNHIFFFKMLWKDSLSKKISLEYVLHCIIRKDDKENERWNFSKKIHGNMTYSSNVLKRWSFQKKLHWNIIFFIIIIRKHAISFSWKYYIFSTDGKWKMILLKKYMEMWCFLYAW